MQNKNEMQQQTLSVLVENTAGVLSQVTRLFTRKGYNIESLAVGVTIIVQITPRIIGKILIDIDTYFSVSKVYRYTSTFKIVNKNEMIPIIASRGSDFLN